ncbi:protein-L-isoaspartate O-methyltransferase family protein [Bradyrhizobium amphicarpaeae]|uniref:Protein-L-isoaspartate O-methyltransferase n=1 Tax=Bradyrhizobium amphicarpaeae TaxID=1404768 RepID=A0A2U8PPL3_9BRAD|nr:methyltransferase domain-containing protein [Bradyrhizobium amphicarpaeae]AWL99671.1 methyltransferase domain-containing protein [Bradyrhizobium amphicarpaeae]
MSDIAPARKRYVEQIRKRGRISSSRLIDAFTSVSRERFAGPGPWRVRASEGREYQTTPDADPIHLYHDVLVAIDEKRRLHTGLPSLWANLFEILDIKAGERVVQIGCGLGYFSAILSELVGPHGQVVAIDCEKGFVAQARANLRGYKNVRALCTDACRNIGELADVIVVHAGFTHPHPLWLQSLRLDGRLLVPLTKHNREGTVVKVTRKIDGFYAEAVRRVEIFPCKGRGETELDEQVADWWEQASVLAPVRFQGLEQGLPSDN